MISGCWCQQRLKRSGMPHTVNELVDEHEVRLDSLLVDLAKVRLGDRNETVQKLEDQRGIRVVPAWTVSPS